MWSRDHFLVTQARGNHREHTSIRINHHFEEGRAVVVYEFLQDSLDSILLGQPHSEFKAVRFCGIHKIFPVEKFFGTAEAFGKEHFLPLTHHAITLVVEQNQIALLPVMRIHELRGDGRAL